MPDRKNKWKMPNSSARLIVQVGVHINPGCRPGPVPSLDMDPSLDGILGQRSGGFLTRSSGRSLGLGPYLNMVRILVCTCESRSRLAPGSGSKSGSESVCIRVHVEVRVKVEVKVTVKVRVRDEVKVGRC